MCKSGDFQKGLTAAKSGDYATALRELTPLAKQGHSTAQNNLGFMYHRGWGVPQNDTTAVKWYTLSAEQGNDMAQYNLGFMYHRGWGVRKDYKTAVKWWKLAAEQGNAMAQGDLSWMYVLGDGVIQDKVYAHMWGNIAASNGEESGARSRDFVAEYMTSADISKAQDLARECVRKKYKGC